MAKHTTSTAMITINTDDALSCGENTMGIKGNTLDLLLWSVKISLV
jgi:hypothetical protein